MLEHDPEKACPALDAGWEPVFPRDKRGTRLCGDHAQNEENSTRECEQALDIEMRLDVIGKRVERAFHLAAIPLA